jgi:cytochrome c2
VFLAAGCSEAKVPDQFWVPGGDPESGRRLVVAYDCGACHTIQGVRSARGIVGPKLEEFAQRTMLAGVVANVPRNLVPWLMDPPAISPETAMPAMGVGEAQARDIAAFLYTLGAERVTSQHLPHLPDPEAAGG